MERTLKRLLSEVIDYAGMYPPASLNMEKALSNYLDYKLSSNNWMLSRFVIGSDNLKELRDKAEQIISSNNVVDFAVNVPQVASMSAYGQNIDLICREILTTQRKLKPRVRMHVMEVKFPDQIRQMEDSSQIAKILERTVAPLTSDPSLPNRIFFEIPGEDPDLKLALRVIKGIGLHNVSAQKRKLKNYLFSGFKVRCGGKSATEIPSPEYLAKILLLCREANVPIKFTAGLHHPYRHHNPNLNADVHGFLNVFCAGILAYTQDLTVEETVQLLSDKNPDNFSFTKENLSWTDFEAPILEVKLLRMLSVLSFGSCSFEEPVLDLKHLNLV